MQKLTNYRRSYSQTETTLMLLNATKQSVCRLMASLAIGMLLGGVSGCVGIGQRSGTAPTVARARPVLPYEITAADLIGHLNQSADRLRSLKSSNCHMVIRMPNGMPVRLKATVACEEPRNFRLVADGSLVVHADVGSNDQHCWWWMQPGENVLFTVPHSEMDYVRAHPLMKKMMSMPFEPDWLMEVLGVTRLKSDGVTLLKDVHPERVNLVSEYVTPDQRRFRRITLVDLHGGRVISHRIVDGSNNTIARASLSEFQNHQGAFVPGKIEVSWPSMEMSLTLTLQDVAVNGQLSTGLWQPPQAKSMEMVNLPNHLRRLEQSGHQFEKIHMTPERPSDRPVFDESIQSAGHMSDDDLPWEDAPAKRRWFRWPFGRK